MLPVLQNLEQLVRRFSVGARHVLPSGGVEEQTLASNERRRQSLVSALAATKEQIAVERQRYLSEIDASQMRKKSLHSQMKLQGQIVAASEESYKNAKSLSEDGYISLIELSRRKEGWLAAMQRQSDLMSAYQETGSEIHQLQLRQREHALILTREIASLERQVSELESQALSLQAEQQVSVLAPSAGTVTFITSHLGQTLDSGSLVVSLLPEGSEILAELFVPSKAIGFVRTGGDVRLALDAYPPETFGYVPASVVEITGAALQSEDVLGAEPELRAIFRVRAQLSQQGMSAFGRVFAFRPGLELRAHMVLETKPFIRWILDSFTTDGGAQ